MNRRLTWTWVAAFLAGAVTVLASLWVQPRLLTYLAEPGRSDISQTADAGNRHSYADAVARAAPAVVNIFSTKASAESSRLVFAHPFLPQQLGPYQFGKARRGSATSLGSGVILSQDGLLLTNRHIVKEADAIRAVLPTGEDLDVRVVAVDAETDLAVLKASARDLPVALLGEPAELRVGDVVLAIGNPYGIGQTVTMGIVSGTGRTRLGITSIENYIQTDASINPGNSGGALINARGQLVGINTAIFSQSGGSEGVGFAIPIDLAKDVMEKLVAEGQVRRGWIGVAGRGVTPQLAESFGLRTETGVLVTTTQEESPAEHAGLRPGDVITQVEHKEVDSTHTLLEAIAAAGPGANIVLEIWRGSERMNVHATTIERPAPPVP